MCEYCGCQALEVVAQLTREHDLVTELIGRIRLSVGADDRVSTRLLCRELRFLLGPHIVVEEQGLFPELQDEYGEHMDGLRKEHADLDAVLADVADHGEWSEELLEALTALRLHILKEQDGVFPAALAALSADAWSRVEQVRTEAAAQPAGDAGSAASTAAQASVKDREPEPTATPAR